jgi:hypothetical protein
MLRRRRIDDPNGTRGCSASLRSAEIKSGQLMCYQNRTSSKATDSRGWSERAQSALRVIRELSLRRARARRAGTLPSRSRARHTYIHAYSAADTGPVWRVIEAFVVGRVLSKMTRHRTAHRHHALEAHVTRRLALIYDEGPSDTDDRPPHVRAASGLSTFKEYLAG